MDTMPDHETVKRWVAAYESAWRTPGTGALVELFSPDATYLQSPYQEPVTGLDQIAGMWEDEREGPDEIFTLTAEAVAVEDDTAVVRAEVRYGDPVRQEYRDLWIMRFDDSGRCSSFEEWPFWPGRPYTAGGSSGIG
jgi:ketosteroid isomerase-like protein